MTTMRAKLRVSGVTEFVGSTEHNGDAPPKLGENLHFSAVAASSYPEDGSDENNTYAKYSPSASFEIYIANPALFGKFKVNEEYYVDFTPANLAIDEAVA